MQLSHLEYLVAVKKYGSMNKAAAALFCTQPTISSAFHTLENELKCKLLERNSSGSSFTKDGERIAADAEVILGIIDSWKQLSASETEILQIAFSPSIGSSTMQNLLIPYRQIEPEIKLNFVPSLRHGADILFSEDRQKQASRFGFFPRTPAELIQTKKDVERLGMCIAMISRGNFLLCMSANDPLAAKQQIFLSDINGREAVLKGGTEGFPYYQYLAQAACDCSMAMGDHENIMISLLSNSNQIAFRPDFILEKDYYVTSGLVAVRKLEGCPMEINRYFIYPEWDRMSKAERKFVEYIRNHAPVFEPK